MREKNAVHARQSIQKRQHTARPRRQDMSQGLRGSDEFRGLLPEPFTRARELLD